MGTKTELRKQMALQKKLLCTSDIRKTQSAKILAAVEACPAFERASTVLLYHSLSDEVDTHGFVKKWSRRKKVLLPVVIGEQLELRTYTDTQHMTIGRYGIEEPTGEVFTNYNDIGFVAVPGVAFDRKGNRLGRGKGYYDRLLPHLPTAYKAGICFPFQLIEEIPTDIHDIRMDIIITINENKLSHPYHPLPSCDRE